MKVTPSIQGLPATQRSVSSTADSKHRDLGVSGPRRHVSPQSHHQVQPFEKLADDTPQNATQRRTSDRSVPDVTLPPKRGQRPVFYQQQEHSQLPYGKQQAIEAYQRSEVWPSPPQPGQPNAEFVSLDVHV